MGSIRFLDVGDLPKGLWTGPGCRHRLGEALDRLAIKRLMVIASASLLRQTDLRQVLDANAGDRLVTITVIGPDGATEAAIDEIGARARDLGIDGVLSAGGGAAHDIAKAVAMIAVSGTGIAEFLGATSPVVQPLPLLTMPSTFSAAETVPGGALIRTGGGKSIFHHPAIRPRYVFLDGDLIATTPRATLAMSGLNAVHHCTEAIYSLGHHPISDAWALFALERLMRLLTVLAPDRPKPPVDIFQSLLEASCISGLAYAVSGLGVGHPICHSLAGRWKIGHGAAHSVVLPHSAAFNREVAADRFEVAQRAIGSPDLLAALDRLSLTLKTPRRLRDIGLAEGQFDVIASDVLEDPITATNPRPVDRAGIEEILRRAW
jgi:alcohol dehydrogenase class IV